MNHKNIIKVTTLSLVVCVALILGVSTTLVIAATNTNSSTNTNTAATVPTVTLIASKTKVPAGGAVSLSWTSTGATTCSASAVPAITQFSGALSFSGTKSVTSSVKEVYTVSCVNAKGTTVKSVTVDVETFIRGDANRDRKVDSNDIVTIANSLNQLRPVAKTGNPALIAPCQDAADANDDGQVTIDDATKLIDFIYGSKKPLAAPNATAGVDSTFDSLTCATY